MIEIRTDDLAILKEVCESLAYKVADYEHPGQYEIPDEQINKILRCEGLDSFIIEE